jgi:hypothetical protein
LYDIKTFCVEHDSELLPHLNMLVLSANTDLKLAGEGMSKWYVEVFGTLHGYEVFCGHHAQLAEYMLQNKLIELT